FPAPRLMGTPRTPHAQQGHRHRLHHAGHQPHLPQRPPHHGADPELLVPARRSQSTNLHGHLHGQTRRLPHRYRNHLPPGRRTQWHRPARHASLVAFCCCFSCCHSRRESAFIPEPPAIHRRL